MAHLYSASRINDSICVNNIYFHSLKLNRLFVMEPHIINLFDLLLKGHNYLRQEMLSNNYTHKRDVCLLKIEKQKKKNRLIGESLNIYCDLTRFSF